MADEKISKQEAKYREASDQTKSCGTCSMFRRRRRDKGICTLVAGEIYDYDTCDYWRAR